MAIARQSLRAGATTVLDFGVWSKEERSALRAIAAAAGAECRLVYLPIDRAEQRRRLDKRAITEPNTNKGLRRQDSAAGHRSAADLDVSSLLFGP